MSNPESDWRIADIVEAGVLPHWAPASLGMA